MKKILYCITLGIASLSFAFPLENNLKVLSLNELIDSDFFQELEKIPKENQEKYLFEQLDSKVIVFIKKDTTLPLKLFINGYFSLINNEKNNTQIKIEKDLYLRIEKGSFLFSDDLKTWKEALAFFTGDIHLGLHKETDGLPQFEIGANLNKRLN